MLKGRATPADAENDTATEFAIFAGYRKNAIAALASCTARLLA